MMYVGNVRNKLQKTECQFTASNSGGDPGQGVHIPFRHVLIPYRLTG